MRQYFGNLQQYFNGRHYSGMIVNYHGKKLYDIDALGQCSKIPW
jgi:hypothetical protein